MSQPVEAMSSGYAADIYHHYDVSGYNVTVADDKVAPELSPNRRDR